MLTIFSSKEELSEAEAKSVRTRQNLFQSAIMAGWSSQDV